MCIYSTQLIQSKHIPKLISLESTLWICENKRGDMGFKRDEIQRSLSECDTRGEHVSGIAFQETWMIDGDKLTPEIDWYKWIGRNRSPDRTLEGVGRSVCGGSVGQRSLSQSPFTGRSKGF